MRGLLRFLAVATAFTFCRGEMDQNMRINLMDVISQSNSYFSSDLYEQLRERQSNGGNFVISPFSLSVLLSTMNCGSRGTTAKEITAALRLTGLNQTDILTGFSDMVQAINKKSGVTLNTANAIYIDSRFTLRKSFEDTVRTYFQSDINQIPFRDVEAAASKINAYVAKKTDNRVKNLIRSAELSQDTQMLLLNTIYLKAEWEKPFDTTRTDKRPFYNLINQPTDATFIHFDGELPYGHIQELEAEAVAIPYKKEEDSERSNSGVSFVILMPTNASDFSNFERKLRVFDLASVPSSLQPLPMALSMPKLRLESDVDFLNEGILKRMGIKTLYQDNGMTGPSPDFSGMTEQAPGSLAVGMLKQRAAMDTNEQGTEASVATFASIVNKIIHKPFAVNRPFVAYVFHAQTKTILFLLRKVSHVESRVS